MRSRRVLLLILCIPAICWIACWPFTDSAVNDDFSYAFTAKRFMETGRLVYAGWSNPILGPQVVWGAAFAQLFGFSHNVLRLSMLPISIVCAALTYRLHRRFEIAPEASAFATLLLIASPLFVAWSASFMTDLPGLLFTLLIFHAALSAAKADRFSSVFLSALCVMVFGVLGGTIRQTNFVMAFVALLMMLARHRRHFASVIALLVFCALHVAAVAWLVRWHARQPYSIPEMWPALRDYLSADWSLVGLLLELCLYLLPLGVVISRISSLRRKVLIGLFAILLSIGLLQSASSPASTEASLFKALWIGNTLTPTGLLATAVDAAGDRPIVFPNAVRAILASAVFWFIAMSILQFRQEETALVRVLKRLRAEPRASRAWALATLLAIALTYVGMLVPRAAFQLVFDRYLLVLIPIVTVIVLCLISDRLKASGIPRLAWALLAIYAFIGIACTRDHFAELRARDRIADELIRSGLPRTAFSNGLAYDAWTELEATGYINDPRIQTPPNAFVPMGESPLFKQFWFLKRTPSVRPKWIVACTNVTPASDTQKAYRFRATLPPFERWLVIVPALGSDPASTSLPELD